MKWTDWEQVAAPKDNFEFRLCKEKGIIETVESGPYNSKKGRCIRFIYQYKFSDKKMAEILFYLMQRHILPLALLSTHHRYCVPTCIKSRNEEEIPVILTERMEKGKAELTKRFVKYESVEEPIKRKPLIYKRRK